MLKDCTIWKYTKGCFRTGYLFVLKIEIYVWYLEVKFYMDNNFITEGLLGYFGIFSLRWIKDKNGRKLFIGFEEKTIHFQNTIQS